MNPKPNSAKILMLEVPGLSTEVLRFANYPLAPGTPSSVLQL